MMTLEIFALISVVVSTMVQLYYWAHAFKQLLSARNYGLSKGKEGISIIICAHNEAENLAKFLPHILTQNYLQYEVIVVNHGSTDSTHQVLEELEKKHIHLRSIYHQQDGTGKRPALLAGLSASQFQRILLTDADCKPDSDQWISHMAAPFDQGAEIVLGPAPIAGSNNLLGSLSRFNAAITYLQYGVATLRSRSYMGVGRNMAYIKPIILERSDLFASKYIGGDDDLLISGHPSNKVSLVTTHKAAMWSNAPSSWVAYLRQKRRHVSVSWQYNWGQKFSLAFFASSHWILLLGLIVLALMGSNYWLLLTVYTLRSWAMVTTMRNEARLFTKGMSTIWILVSDALYLLLYPIIAVFLSMKPPAKW